MSRLIHFRAHLSSAAVSRQHENGIEYVIAPAVMVREMVLNGELLPFEEIENSVAEWERMPVTVGHVSDDYTAERVKIGEIRKPRLNHGKLWGDLWIRVDANQSDSKDIISRIDNGDTLEVSTAYIAIVDPGEGEFKDRRYNGIQRDIAPLHLAILPDAIGACSLDDGCGVPRANVLNAARVPAYDGVETTAWPRVDKSIAAYANAWAQATGNTAPENPSIENLSDAAKQWIAAKTLIGDGRANSIRDLVFFPVVNPATNRLNRGALTAVMGGRGAQANIPRAALESARAKARNLLDSQFGSREQIQRENLDFVPGSHDHRKRLLWRAVQQQFANQPVDGDSYPVIQEVFDDYVIAEQGGVLWRIPYTIAGDEAAPTITLGERNRAKVEFTPVENVLRRIARFFQRKENSTMDRTKAVEVICNAVEGVKADCLKDLADDAVIAMAKAVANKDAESPKAKPKAEAKAEPAAPFTLEQMSELVTNALKEFKPELSPEDQEALARMKQNRQSERERLEAAAIRWNGAGLGADDVKSLSDEALRKLASKAPKSSTAADYSGAMGSVSNSSPDEFEARMKTAPVPGVFSDPSVN